MCSPFKKGLVRYEAGLTSPHHMVRAKVDGHQHAFELHAQNVADVNSGSNLKPCISAGVSKRFPSGGNMKKSPC